MTVSDKSPSVLIIAGNDPSGGAGIQADIQAISDAGVHPAPVITALTVQDTRNAYDVQPVDAGLVFAQAETVLKDLAVRAIKLGLLGTPEIANRVAYLLRQHASIPVILDPVLVAAGGARLGKAGLRESLRRELLPCTTIVTPNASEIRALAPDLDTNHLRAMHLVEQGADYVLVKGGDEDTPRVVNILFGQDGERARYTFPRLPHEYHGSGCTLAAAIAARLALGHDLGDAVQDAQDYTFKALSAALTIGGGQRIPKRIRPGARSD